MRLITLTLTLIIVLSLLQADYIRDDSKDFVLDTTTNLVWQDDITPISMNWSSAIDYCEDLTLGEYSNWRLPNFNELYFLADRSTVSPAISSIFQNVLSSRYWSSTTYADDTNDAWIVNFDDGNDFDNNKTRVYNVRCVR